MKIPVIKLPIWKMLKNFIHLMTKGLKTNLMMNIIGDTLIA